MKTRDDHFATTIAHSRSAAGAPAHTYNAAAANHSDEGQTAKSRFALVRVPLRARSPLALQIVALTLLGAAVADGQVLHTDKTVVAWGNNFNGQTNVPPDLTNAVAVAAGAYHSLALKADKTVVAWGLSTSGETNVPANLTNVAAIARGWNHSLALKADKTVVAWGSNSEGQTNVPPGLTNVEAVAGGGQFSLALKADKTVVAWGRNVEGQTNVPPGLTDVEAIAGGGFHCLALKADKTVVAWGRNLEGQTNVPPDLSNVVAIAAGDTFSMALKQDKTVVAWGNGQYGQTNVPPEATNVVEISAGAHHALALKADKTVVAWGRNNFGQTNVPSGLTNAAAMAGGGYHNLALAQKPAEVQSYTLAIQAGLNLIANQLDHGSNTLSEIMPSVPNGCVLYKYDNAGGAYRISSFFDVWLETAGGPVTLNPGEGAWLQSPTNFLLTFSGTPHVPVLPVTIPNDQCYLLSRQTNDVGTWVDLCGRTPVGGEMAYSWNSGWTVCVFDGLDLVWYPSEPVVPIGTPMWIDNGNGGGPAPLFFKANNTTALTQPSSWSVIGVGTIPGPTDIPIWDNTVNGPMTNELGANLTWGGIKIINPGGPVFLTGSNTLSLDGVSVVGIDLSGASQDLTVDCPVTVASNQTWTVGGGRTLTMKSVIVSAPVRIDGPGAKRIDEMQATGVYPAEYTGSSRTELGIVGGPVSLVQSGSGTLALTGTGSYSGGTTVSNGTLQLVANPNNTVAGVCSALGTNTLAMSDGTTLQLLADTNVTFAGGGKPVLAGSVTVNLVSVTPGNSNLALAFAPGDLISSNAIISVTGSNGLSLDLGTIKLRGPVKFETQGPFVHVSEISSNGIYPAEFNGSSYGTPSGIDWSYGDGRANNSSIGRINGVSEFTKSGPDPLVVGDCQCCITRMIVDDGLVALAGDSTGITGTTYVHNGATLVLLSTASNTAGGVCAAAPSGPLQMESGSSLWMLCDSNTAFAGGPSLIQGDVNLNVGPLTPGVSNQTVAFGPNGVTLSNAMLTVHRTNNYKLEVNSIEVSGSAKVGGTDLRIREMHATGIYPAEFNGSSLIEVGPMSGGLSVLQSGSGILLMSGTTTYSGGTTVSNGTLLVNGLLGEPVVNVGEPVVNVEVIAGTLGGTGTITRPVTIQAGATLSPWGGGIKTDKNGVVMTVSNTLTLAGTVLMSVNRTNVQHCDQVRGITTLTCGGTLTVTNVGPALQAGDTFNLFQADSFFDVFLDLNLPPLDLGLSWDTSRLAVDGSISVTSVPPASITLQRGSGGTFTLSWPPNQGWTLQQTTNLPGAWLDVATTTNSYPVVPVQPRQFYRLKLGP